MWILQARHQSRRRSGFSLWRKAAHSYDSSRVRRRSFRASPHISRTGRFLHWKPEDPLGFSSLVFSVIVNLVSACQSRSLSKRYSAFTLSQVCCHPPHIGGREVVSRAQNRGINTQAFVEFSVCRTDEMSSIWHHQVSLKIELMMLPPRCNRSRVRVTARSSALNPLLD